MPRKKQVVQRKHRQKVYGAEESARPLDLKPKGAFKIFHNYKLFAVIGAIVMVGSFGFGAFARNNNSSNGTSSTRDPGVRFTTPEAGSTSTTGASSNAKQYTGAPPLTIDPNKTYTAVIKTEQGDVKLELLAKDSPDAVNNFVFLANDHFYDGTTFYRVIAKGADVQFVQAGDPTGQGTGGPGYTLPFTDPAPAVADIFGSTAGVLALAKPQSADQPNNGSQFFITTTTEPTFNGKYTPFGKVADDASLAVLKKLQPRDPQLEQDPPPGARITSIEIQSS